MLFTGRCGRRAGRRHPRSGRSIAGRSKVYLDLSFFQELAQRLGAPGDFLKPMSSPWIGHHVQNLLGVADRQTRMQQRSSAAERNALSVRLELQADCFAESGDTMPGRATNLIEPGDFEAGLRAAGASVTTDCRRCHKAMCNRKVGPTGHPNNG